MITPRWAYGDHVPAVSHKPPYPVVLFRRDGTNHDEYEAAKRHIHVLPNRAACVGNLVIGRYSVLPYYRELETDLKYQTCKLVNSHEQHDWIAGFHYYDAVEPYTFKTWDDRAFPASNHHGPFVVKGKTNSKKHHWNKMMFAPTRADAIDIAGRLMEDPLIAQQGVIYREYVPLKTFEVGLNGLPFTNEWRCFYLGKRRLAHGYYWTEAEDVESPSIDEAGLAFADAVAEIVSQYVDFFVLDVGEKKDGGWVLIEINDAQMSGLSMIDPDVFYSALAEAVEGFPFSQLG